MRDESIGLARVEHAWRRAVEMRIEEREKEVGKSMMVEWFSLKDNCFAR